MSSTAMSTTLPNGGPANFDRILELNNSIVTILRRKAPKESKDALLSGQAKELLKPLLASTQHDTETVRSLLRPEDFDSPIDDCICWHLLMEIVQGSKLSEATIELSTILIEQRPFLAFEYPTESDEVVKEFQHFCKYKREHVFKSKNKEETPFHVAARLGHHIVVTCMIRNGKQLYERFRAKGSNYNGRSRPKFSAKEREEEDYTFIEILQRECLGSSPLTLAGNSSSFETVQALLAEPGIATIFEETPSKPDRFVKVAIRYARAQMVAELVSQQPDIVTKEPMLWAIESLKKTVEGVKGGKVSKEDRDCRSEIFRMMVTKAKDGTFDTTLMDSLIKHGRVEDYQAIPKSAMEKRLYDVPLYLAVKHQNLEFVKYFIGEDSQSVLRKAPTEDAKYPLGYLKGSPPKDEEIRNLIVTGMLRTSATMEELSDIFSSSQVQDICFDMSHVNSANYRVSDIIDSMIRLDSSHKRHLTYEKILRYAAFPQLDLFMEDRQTFRAGRSLDNDHSEVFDVLKWLKHKKVEIIMKLKVPDRLVNPHDDIEMADQIDDFKVEDLDWKVLDLSIANLRHGTKQRLEKLHLYSSGNRAVVSHWFSNEGINSLSKLNEVYITIVQETCTQSRANLIAGEIRDRRRELKDANLRRNTRVTIRPWFPTPGLANLSELAARISPKLAEFLKDLGDKVRKRRVTLIKRTKVAILDNGILSIPPPSQIRSERDDPGPMVASSASTGPNTHDKCSDEAHDQAKSDSKSLWSRIEEGRSFVDADSRHSHWYLASDAHGTQMMNLICALDPFCEIYIARVAEDKEGFTPKRVQKAIAWARSKKVDIISMSFILKEKNSELDDEIEGASKDGIVMTCSTHDEGSRLREAYPASLKESNKNLSMLVLAACNQFGTPLREIEKPEYQYLFKGENVAAGVIPFLKSDDTISGSSVATALAAGLCSLILTCNRLKNPETQYQGKIGDGSRYSLVTKCLDAMKSRPGSFFVLLENFGGKNSLNKPHAADEILNDWFGRN